MSVAEATLPVAPTQAAPAPAPSGLRQRLRDYLAMAKPRIIVMAAVLVCVGFVTGGGRLAELGRLAHTLAGVALAAAASFILNQLLEARTDARMARTRNRPLPAGRVSRLEVALLGLGCGALGVGWLALWVGGLAATLTALTFLSYVALYTPLKRLTHWNTAIGAVPGALPPTIGWVAATGELGTGAWLLFAILFLWQFPHFFAIAWIYRDEYSLAGLRMLPVVDPGGERVSREMLATCLALWAVSLAPVALGLAGWVYLGGALLLGAMYFAATLRFVMSQGLEEARGVFRVSLIYLPCLFLLLGLSLEAL